MLLFIAACNEVAPLSDGPGVSPAGDEARVVRVSDGDSLIVEIDGRETKVRLIGINAPELDECYGSEARARLGSLVLDRSVTLVADEDAEDQYGRMLSYVYVDGSLVNEELVAGGFVMARSYQPNTTFESDLAAAQDRARQAGAGMWASDTCSVESSLHISSIRADAQGPDGDNLNDEWIEISNSGSEPLSLTNWSLRDAESVNRYLFPAGSILMAGDRLRISTGCGEDRSDHLFWCAPGPVWNNSGDVGYLLDPDGRIADRFEF